MFSATELQSAQSTCTISFTVNHKPLEVARHIDPATKLVDFLRVHAGTKSVKVGCGEGGCGACAVEVTSKDAATGQLDVRTVNACLVPVANLDGCSIITAEGLGSSQTEFSALQERIAGFNGSQCGFCTPGMLVACHAALHKAQAQGRTLGTHELERSIDGNLCRCTGYRPILDTCKSFADGMDMEDLGVHMGELSTSRSPVVQQLHIPPNAQVSKSFHSSNRIWHAPVSLQELWQLLTSYSACDQKIRLVGGSTGAGIYKNWISDEDVIIATTHVPELRLAQPEEDGLHFGGAATIADVIDLVESVSKTSHALYWRPIVTHLGRIAGHHVRNAATLGGHFALCVSEYHLESDVATVLVGAGAWLCVADATSERWMPVEEFLLCEHQNLGKTEIITAVKVPYPNEDTYFYSDRAAQRYYNSHSFVNMSFRCDVNAHVEDARLVLAYHAPLQAGGVGWCCRRLSEVEDILNGRVPSYKVLTEVLQAVENAVNPAGEHVEFVKQVTPGMVLQALAPLVLQYAPPPTPLLPLLDATPLGEPPVVQSKQQFPDYSQDAPPVWQPIVKDRAKLQASGEALYTGDLPLTSDAIFGSFVLSREALASIEVDASEALKVPGVVAYFGAQDVPAQNAAALPADPRLEADPIFADKDVQYVGQPIGLVVATSQSAADAGAEAVLVAYNKQLGKPLITLEEAIAAESFYDPDTYDPISISKGNSKRAMKKAHRTITGGSWYLPSQYHFYMEPMTAIAESDEGGSVKIWSSCQSTDMVQQAVSRALGIRYHNIVAVCRRAGGGFGAKASRAQPFAVAAAIAAAKLKRQVRIENNRNKDMRMVGGRSETKVKYDVAYEPDGTILGVSIKAWFRGGAWMDLALQDMQIMADGIDQVYTFPNFSLDCLIARTNVPPRTNMRAPGFFQANLIIEHIIEHVACELGVEAALVREMNFLRPAPAVPPTPSLYSTPSSLSHASSTGLTNDSAFHDDTHGKGEGKQFICSGDSPRGHASRKGSEDLHDQSECSSNSRSEGFLWSSVRKAFSGVFAAKHQAPPAVRIPDPGHLSRDSSLATNEADPVVETTFGHVVPVNEYTLPKIWNELKHKAEYEARLHQVKEFNLSNKWQKKGLAITACRYHMVPPAQPAAVSIYGDGSIVVAAAGAEIGQGLFTKVKQVAVYELSKVLPSHLRPIPLELVRIADNSSELLPNAGCTGGSTTSEASCEAVRRACSVLAERMKPFVTAAGPQASWADICAQILPPAGAPPNTLMSEYAYYDGNGVNPDGSAATEKLDYSSFGAAVSEVIIDILTGDRRVLRTDLLFDCGRSINPAVDIGQVEGAFVQGLGFVLQEEVVIHPVTGANLTDSTWEYKIPTAACIPREFYIHLLKDSPNPRGIMSSKAVGEPPLLLSSSVLIAFQSAVSAAVRELNPGLANGRCHMMPQGLKMEPPCAPRQILSAVGSFSVASVLKAAEDKLKSASYVAASLLDANFPTEMSYPESAFSTAWE